MRTTCSLYATYELPKEVAVHGCRKANATAGGLGATSTSVVLAGSKHKKGGMSNTVATTGTARRKTLNLNIPKWHALGDYVLYIRHHGTTDGMSTQSVCLSSHLPYIFISHSYMTVYRVSVNIAVSSDTMARPTKILLLVRLQNKSSEIGS
jgi:hypothetical protein